VLDWTAGGILSKNDRVARIEWERHTEAVSHTVFVPGNGQPPFSESAIDFVSREKRDALIDRMLIGLQVEVIEPEDAGDP
jgi:hypothetical protein